MERQPVRSSNVVSLGWEPSPEGAGVLEVEFLGGAVYRYDGVPRATYEAIRDAESVGAAFYRYVRAASYVARRITGDA